ncbi:hypothetical protein HZS_3169 [Henneguya salminicola]|nr:hypothetical protein HZS_3169 [Henneguya salminicola]
MEELSTNDLLTLEIQYLNANLSKETINSSVAIKKFRDYIEENIDKDPFIVGITPENPYYENYSKCRIL